MRHDERVRTALGDFILLNVEIKLDGANESASPIERVHLSKASTIYADVVEALAGDDALAAIKWQQEVIVAKNANWFELGAGHVQMIEWKLHVCECQLAKRRQTHARKRNERCEFVAEHDCFELLLAIAELLRQLVVVQLEYELVVSSLDTVQKCLLLGDGRSHPLAHIFDGDLG